MRNKLVLGIGSVLVATHLPAGAGNVDAKLLDMLLANGSITTAQHAELKADLESEAKAQSARNEREDKLHDKLSWASRVRIAGDMRLRNETIDIEGEASNGGREKDRQRIRARLGVYADVTPEVEVGLRIASGNGADPRSTNQDLNNYFEKKNLWLDLAYIDYHPEALPGLHLSGGKMVQPWVAVGDIVWDGDINPEGFAAAYRGKAGRAEIFGSTGLMVLKDSVDGDGVRFGHDLTLFTAQIGSSFALSESTKLMLGLSLNDFANERFTAALGVFGNTTDRFRLYEMFGQLDLNGLPVPVSMYGQLVKNDAARDFGQFADGDEDTAWLFGVKTKIGGIGIDYNYRDVERNAVVSVLTDSDFALGFTGNDGHKLKLKYDLQKNFSVGLTWYSAESLVASRYRRNAQADTIHLDLEAKF